MTVRMVLALLGSYLLGSLPTAYLAVRWRTGGDIRTMGSGNVGATNAARAAGAGMGVVVFAVDALKGVAAAWLPALLWGAPGRSWPLLCGSLAVIGHNFPWALGFRGGKGVATTMGALLGADPAIAGVAGIVWVAMAAIVRYVSVASMAAALIVPLGQWWWGRSPAECALGAALGGFIVIRHHENVARLRVGREPKIGVRASSANRQGSS